MKKYSIQPVNVENDFVWELLEKESEHVIGHFFFEEDCIAAARFMENGGAFDGWTPSFMLQPVVVPRDINQEFIAAFSDAA